MNVVQLFLKSFTLVIFSVWRGVGGGVVSEVSESEKRIFISPSPPTHIYDFNFVFVFNRYEEWKSCVLFQFNYFGNLSYTIL